MLGFSKWHYSILFLSSLWSATVLFRTAADIFNINFNVNNNMLLYREKITKESEESKKIHTIENYFTSNYSSGCTARGKRCFICNKNDVKLPQDQMSRSLILGKSTPDFLKENRLHVSEYLEKNGMYFPGMGYSMDSVGFKFSMFKSTEPNKERIAFHNFISSEDGICNHFVSVRRGKFVFSDPFNWPKKTTNLRHDDFEFDVDSPHFGTQIFNFDFASEYGPIFKGDRTELTDNEFETARDELISTLSSINARNFDNIKKLPRVHSTMRGIQKRFLNKLFKGKYLHGIDTVPNQIAEMVTCVEEQKEWVNPLDYLEKIRVYLCAYKTMSGFTSYFSDKPLLAASINCQVAKNVQMLGLNSRPEGFAQEVMNRHHVLLFNVTDKIFTTPLSSSKEAHINNAKIMTELYFYEQSVYDMLYAYAENCNQTFLEVRPNSGQLVYQKSKGYKNGRKNFTTIRLPVVFRLPENFELGKITEDGVKLLVKWHDANSEHFILDRDFYAQLAYVALTIFSGSITMDPLNSEMIEKFATDLHVLLTSRAEEAEKLDTCSLEMRKFVSLIIGVAPATGSLSLKVLSSEFRRVRDCVTTALQMGLEHGPIYVELCKISKKADLGMKSLLQLATSCSISTVFANYEAMLRLVKAFSAAQEKSLLRPSHYRLLPSIMITQSLFLNPEVKRKENFNHTPAAKENDSNQQKQQTEEQSRSRKSRRGTHRGKRSSSLQSAPVAQENQRSAKSSPTLSQKVLVEEEE